jgi:hypothetical protein
VADVRRAVWNGGFSGLGFGLGAGFGAHWLSKRFLPPTYFPVQFKQGKYAFLWTLGLGAVGSFAGASSAGKNNVGSMHHVFERNAKPQLTEYQAQTHQDPEQARRDENDALQRRYEVLEAARRKRAEEEADWNKRTRG